MKKVKIILISIVVILAFAIVIFLNYETEHVVLENSNSVTKEYSESLSMMLETEVDSGMYEVTDDTSWPGTDYVFNETLSKCRYGSTITYNSETNMVYFSGTSKDYCYVYFDLAINISSPVIESTSDTWSSENVIVSVKSSGTTNAGEIAYYEYYTTVDTEIPSNDAVVSGTTEDEITISDEGTTYVYYRSVDTYGNTSSWSNAAVAYIDKTSPSIAMISGSQDVMASTTLVTSVSFGSSGGSYSCANTTYSNTSVSSTADLYLGLNTVTCIATSNAGLSSSVSNTLTMSATGITATSSPYHLSATNGAYVSGSSIIVPTGGIQYGPYIPTGAGCYYVWYYGSDMGEAQSYWDVHYNAGGIFYTISNKNYVVTDGNYYVYIDEAVPSLEMRIDYKGTDTVTVDSINIYYSASSC